MTFAAPKTRPHKKPRSTEVVSGVPDRDITNEIGSNNYNPEGNDMKDNTKRPTVEGVGVNDLQSPKDCPYYDRWKKMLKRCYSGNWPSYEDCAVCDEWLTFSNFKSWMEKQDWKNKELDKDIIEPGCRVYSPDSCCFVPPDINRLLLHIKPNAKTGDLPVGVLEVENGRYRARIRIDKKKVCLGRYDTEAAAGHVYRMARAKYLRSIAENQRDARVKHGLHLHADRLEKYFLEAR